MNNIQQEYIEKKKKEIDDLFPNLTFVERSSMKSFIHFTLQEIFSCVPEERKAFDFPNSVLEPEEVDPFNSALSLFHDNIRRLIQKNEKIQNFKEE